MVIAIQKSFVFERTQSRLVFRYIDSISIL